MSLQGYAKFSPCLKHINFANFESNPGLAMVEAQMVCKPVLVPEQDYINHNTESQEVVNELAASQIVTGSIPTTEPQDMVALGRELLVACREFNNPNYRQDQEQTVTDMVDEMFAGLQERIQHAVSVAVGRAKRGATEFATRELRPRSDGDQEMN